MSERVCPHCGAPLEGMSIYEDTICDYCGSEVKGEKREETQTQTQRVREKSKYTINWVDTYVTDSNYTNRQRCVAIPKGEKRALKIKVYFDTVQGDAVENARLTFISLNKQKIVAEDMIKTELKKGDTTITYQKPMGSFEEGEYLAGVTLDGGTDFFYFSVIVGSAPLIKENISTAENRQICAQTALNVCRARKLSATGMIPVQFNIMSIQYGAKYKELLGIPEGVETYMIFETSLRKAKKGLAICSDGIYLKADSKRVHLSWYDFLFKQISTTEGGFKISEYWFVNWSGGSELMADLLSDIQRRIIDAVYKNVVRKGLNR